MSGSAGPITVPLIDLAAEYAELGAAVQAAVARVLASGRFILGPEVEAFEEELAAACGVRHAVGVSSGTDALLATLMALGVGPGAEVLTPAYSFVATAEVVLRLGARPVFCDIEPESFNIDPSDALRRRSDATRVVLPVHLFGRPAQVGAWSEPVIEDAAQATGVPLRGLAATLSFYPTKNLGAAGDGGAVLTNDEALAVQLRRLRQHGSGPRNVHTVTGGNFRLDAIQAAILRVKLPFLREWTARRVAAAERYRGLFAHAGLPMVRLPSHCPGHVYNQFVVRVPQREALRAALAAAGVATEVYYPRTLPAQPAFAPLAAGPFPVAEALAASGLALPMGPWLRPDQQERVVEAIAAFFAANPPLPAPGA